MLFHLSAKTIERLDREFAGRLIAVGIADNRAASAVDRNRRRGS